MECSQFSPPHIHNISDQAILFSLLYGTPAPSSECQHPEAWPASTYGHLRGVSLTFKILTFEKSADLLEKVSGNIHFDIKGAILIGMYAHG